MSITISTIIFAILQALDVWITYLAGSVEYEANPLMKYVWAQHGFYLIIPLKVGLIIFYACTLHSYRKKGKRWKIYQALSLAVWAAVVVWNLWALSNIRVLGM